MNTDFNDDNNKYGCTIVNTDVKKSPISNNFKYSYKSRRIKLNKNFPDIKCITSVKTVPNITFTNLIFTPTSNNISNSEGLKTTSAQIAVYGEIQQTITYKSIDTLMEHFISETIPFSTFIILDNRFMVNKKPSINVTIEDVYIYIKNPRDLSERISLFFDVS